LFKSNEVLISDTQSPTPLAWGTQNRWKHPYLVCCPLKIPNPRWLLSLWSQLNRQIVEINWMWKLISDHVINNTIVESVNSGSIKKNYTYVCNFSFKISFSFLNQSLQGNLHKMIKQKLHGYQNHLKLSCRTCRENKDRNCTSCFTFIVQNLYDYKTTFSTYCKLECRSFYYYVLFSLPSSLTILSYLCFSKTII